MFHSILVPIDTSQPEAGASALALATDVAKVRGGSLILLSVVERLPGYVASQIPVEVVEGATRDAGATLRDMARAAGLSDDARVIVRDGHPAREILDCAGEIGADLIVIASHDPSLADFFLGSVAANVVRHAHCSVLVARNLED